MRLGKLAAVAELVDASGVVEEAVAGMNDEYALPEDIADRHATHDPDGNGQRRPATPGPACSSRIRSPPDRCDPRHLC